MRKENVTVLRKIIYAVESGGQVYGCQDYSAFDGVGENCSNEVAITIGAGQWYAGEAKRLLQLIQKKYPAVFRKKDTSGIAADLKKDWTRYGVEEESAKGMCIISIIATPQGIKCQDELMESQITEYAEAIEKTYGPMGDDAMMECINIIHQGGAGAVKRILSKTRKPYTAEAIYNALNTDPADKSSDNQVGDYTLRQKKVFEMINRYAHKDKEPENGGDKPMAKKTRSAVVSLAQSWVGLNEADGSYKKIIDTYNSYKGSFPRNVKMEYGWAWCACTWSALAIKLGYTDIMPIEISCGYLVERAQNMGIWVENDSYVPKPGDAVLYFWNDTGNGDCTGWPDHVGTVEKVSGNTITVIEGNYSDSVKRRTIQVNARYIRGYICPKYDADGPAPSGSASGKKTVDELAKEVLAGAWGSGEERRSSLTAAGYDYNAVQKRVNELLSGSSTKKSIDEIAEEVISGKWGSGDERKSRLEADGYSYYEVQKKVNQLLS